MSHALKELLSQSRSVKMSSEDQEKQRVSFAYGNTHFENEAITRETVEKAAEQLRDSGTTH